MSTNSSGTKRKTPERVEREADRRCPTADEMAAEIDRITSTWIVDDRPTKFPSVKAVETYISRVPTALNCLNRAARERPDSDALYDLKYQVMLLCARLGWARDCADGDGYRVDRYGFHLVGPALDCSHGNARRHRNLDMTKIDDLDRALAILEVFVEAHPLTEVESAKLRAYRMQQSAWRAQGIEFDDFDDLDDLDEDEGWTS